MPNVSNNRAPVGILMLDTRFERLLGDIGNPDTWPFPVFYECVPGASPEQVVINQEPALLQAFKRAADKLMAQGVVGITTTCGFLGLYQDELASYCRVPVATSALLQVPLVERLLGDGQRVGILTYSEESLSADHLSAVGVSVNTPIVGMPKDSDFYRWIMEGDNTVTIEQLRRDVVNTARRLVESAPDIGAIVSECTNLTPFASDIRLAVQRPVYDMVSLMHWFRMGLQPLHFTQQQ